MAAIAGLKSLEGKQTVSIYTDSKYLADSIMLGWAKSWRGKGWMRNKKEKASNSDLWAALLNLCEQHEVQFFWVRGHAGHVENEQCDSLAVEAAKMAGLPPDVGFEEGLREPQMELL